MTITSAIRPATADDATAIADVCTRAARVAYADLVTSDYLDRVVGYFFTAERVRREAVPGPDWFGFVVAEDAGAIVAVAGTGQSAHHAEACELFALYVDPAAQRRGIGRSLVEHALDGARDAGAARLDVAVMPGNSAAVRFYERCGFTPAGEREIYAPHGKEGGPPMALLLQRVLRPAGTR
jgi:ribosomal protein S18 acetylase RimI-like enzyme